MTSGTAVAPIGLEGSYTEVTGLIYLFKRFYDPSTDQFLSIDSDVQQTDQPYVFTNDDPLNSTDPLGLWSWNPISDIKQAGKDVGHFVATHKVADGIVLGVLSVATGGVALEVVALGEAGFAAAALGATGVVTGFGASALDANACKKGSATACGGAILGVIGASSGGAALLGPLFGMSSATAYKLTATSLTAGSIAAAYDATVKLISLIPSKKKR